MATKLFSPDIVSLAKQRSTEQIIVGNERDNNINATSLTSTNSTSSTLINLLTPSSITPNAVTPTTSTSDHWTGYCAHSYSTHYVDGVIGTFSFNTLQSTMGSMWIGIGGTNLNSFIQTGIGYNPNSNPSTPKAWVEAYPARPVYSFSIHAGDLITAGISFDYDTSEWFVYIQDDTTGTYQSWNESVSAYKGTAEWILEEDPNQSIGSWSYANFQ